MKKQLLKLTLSALFMLFSFSVLQAQDPWVKDQHTFAGNGYYTFKVPNQDLVLTVDPFTTSVSWQPEIGNSDTQIWKMEDHVTPASAGLMQITAQVDVFGTIFDFTLTTNATDPGPDATTPEKRELSLAVKVGAPLEVEPGDFSGLDQFQRRKNNLKSDDPEDPDKYKQASNDALFIKTPWDGGSRFGVTPSAAGDPVQFDNGSIDILEYKLVELLSANSFGVDAFSIANPIKDQLVIKGATSQVKEVSLYSLVGNKVLSTGVDSSNGNIEINVNSLSAGIYILDIAGENGERYTEKIIKQ